MDLKGVVALVTGGNGGLGQRICHALAQEGAHVAVMYARSRDQAESVASAARDAEASGLADPVVLLSPACASFDQYRNFEIRGTKFRELVMALRGVKPVV